MASRCMLFMEGVVGDGRERAREQRLVGMRRSWVPWKGGWVVCGDGMRGKELQLFSVEVEIESDRRRRRFVPREGIDLSFENGVLLDAEGRVEPSRKSQKRQKWYVYWFGGEVRFEWWCCIVLVFGSGPGDARTSMGRQDDGGMARADGASDIYMFRLMGLTEFF